MHTSIAERIAYGTPVDADVETTRIHVVPRPWTALVGRILLAAIFLISGFAKLTDPQSAAAYIHNVGLSNAYGLAIIAGLVEVLGGASLLLGFLARVGALGLVIYLAIVTYFFHGFWRLEGAEAHAQMVQFV